MHDPILPRRVLLRTIQTEAARLYGLDPATMTSDDRTRTVAHPRQLAMYLSRKLTRNSLPEIGRRFGGKDHTTVIHAIRQVEKRLELDPKVAKAAACLRELVDA